MKIDHKKVFPALYQQSKKEISIIEIPDLNYLTIRGVGDPNNNEGYSQAVGALYAVAYKLKFALKNSPAGVDYSVMPLEGLWWAENMNLFNLKNRGNWQWQMMIMQPNLVTPALFKDAFDEVQRKKNPPRLDEVRFETYHEGLCAQIFHAGPYGEGETVTVEKLHHFISEQGYEKSGKHHEIYLNSPLRVSPEKLQTIIRQPVKKV